MSTPADELRAAAEKLRELASKATTGICPDWIYSAVRHVARNCTIDCSHDDHQSYEQPEWDRYEDSPYIAVMHPGVGAALADWLDETAEQYEAAVVAARQVWGDEGEPKAREWLTTGHGRVGKQSLAVARAINGSQP